ncbi:SH3 domain-containing protein, partial [Escherichia coli]
VRKQAIRPKARKKATCVDVDGNSKACKDSANGTWILN